MTRRRLVLCSYLIACAIEVPFILSPKMHLGFALTFYTTVLWHYVPFRILGWVDAYHPLGNFVFQAGLFLMQTLLITPVVFLLFLLMKRGGQKPASRTGGGL